MRRIASWICDEEEAKKLLDFVLHTKIVNAKSVELPPVVPIVPLHDVDTPCWANFDAVIVEFQELMKGGILDKVLDEGIHTYLNYDGFVVLSSIMHDDLLIQNEIFDLFIKTAQRAGFDAVLGWDAPVYVDLPLYHSWVNILKGLELTYKLHNLGKPVIALLKGNTERQISFSFEALMSMGVKNLALHASEYLVQFKVDPYARNVLYWYGNEARRRRIKNLLILGALRPTTFMFIKKAFVGVEKLSIAGLSWYLDAKKFILYAHKCERRFVDKFFDCRCEACSSLEDPIQLLDALKFRAWHNLNYMVKMIADIPVSEGEIYDLILKRGKAIIASDIHAWTPESLMSDFLDFLMEEEPRYIILLGDIFDLVKGRPSLYSLPAFFNTLRKLKAIVVAVKGCSEDDEGVLRAMDSLVLAAVKTPLRYKMKKTGEDLMLRDGFLDFYRFYRFAKDRLLIKLPNGEKLLAEHGHKYLDKYRENTLNILEEQLKSSGVDWLIVGHLHKAFLDEEKHIASPGCWQYPPEHLKGIVGKEDLRKAIIINEKGKMELYE